MRAVIISALLSLGMVGCAGDTQDKPQSDFQVYLDPAFTAEQTADILGVLDVWTQESGGLHPLTFHYLIGYRLCDDQGGAIGGGSCWQDITIHPSTQEDITAMDPEHGDLLGLTRRRWSDDWLHGPHDWSNIYLATDVKQDDFRRVATHEVGHALALVHTEPGTIMCAYITCQPENLTAADVQQYNKLRDWTFQ